MAMRIMSTPTVMAMASTILLKVMMTPMEMGQPII
jgi:hypothetical protein